MEKKHQENSRSPRKRIINFLVHVLLAVLALIWVMPIVWIVLTSFRAEPGAYTNTFLPKSYTIQNYVKLLTDTLIIAICSCCISTSFVLSVSYSLSRMRFKMRKPYMNMAMILGLFPGFMTMIAQYFILKAMGLTEGASIRFGLIIVYSACTGLGFQISKGFFDTIPKAIDEAAVIDGATRWQIFTKITMPLSKPIIIYTIMTSFIAPEFRPVHGRHWSVEHAAEGIHLSVVYLLRRRRGADFRADCHTVPLSAEVLCRGHVGSGQGISGRAVPYSAHIGEISG